MKLATTYIAYIMLSLALLAAPGCGERESEASSSGDGLRGKLVLTGSSTVAPLAGDVNAIGYVSVGTADYEIGRGVPIRLLPMDGVEATTANVRNGSFPMSRPLNLVTHGPVSPLAQAFIDFARSSEANDLVEAQYFVPITE